MKSFGILVLILSLNALGAPYPVTSTSLYVSSKKNYFLLPFSISLNLEKSDYFIDLTEEDTDRWTIRKNNSSLLITMRFRRFKSDSEYEKSLKNWVKEYQKSGLQLVQKQIGDKRPKTGWLHMQDSSGQQILQYFSYLSHDKIWVFFNCIGKKEEFKSLYTSCRQLNSYLETTAPLHR